MWAHCKEWRPAECKLPGTKLVLDVFDTFTPEKPPFTSCVWGPYDEDTFAGGLWMFQGTVGPDRSGFLLRAVEGPWKFELTDSDRHNVLRQCNFDAIMGRELLQHVKGAFTPAPVVNLDEEFKAKAA